MRVAAFKFDVVNYTPLINVCMYTFLIINEL